MIYRALTPQEINALKTQNCIADNWDNIEVADNFTPDYIRHVNFSGKIKIVVF
jgi:hypothetical protein